MQLREFYSRLLPKTGRYVLFQNKQNSFYPTIDALIAATEKRIDTQGLYFATATYGAADNRTQANVILLQAHRIDIDAGEAKYAKDPDNTYPTQRDALAALIAAIKAGLPAPTMIVSSGEGLHVYWQLLQAVAPMRWKTTAKLLGAAGAALGLRIDTSCTTDEARVLRPVGTLHKNGARVTVLKDTGLVHHHDELHTKLEALAPQQDTLPAMTYKPTRSINDDVLSAVEGPPSSLARVAEHCAAVAEMRDSEGNVPEPLWRAVLGVAKYCADGQEVAHDWSSGYEGYSEQETQEKLDRWETPPSTCAHFSTLFKGCATCQYRGKITTPKQLGYIAVQPEPTPADPEIVDEPAPSMALDDEPEHATADNPVPDRPDLFDPESKFFYIRGRTNWVLMHKMSEARTDATGQKVFQEVTRPVAHRLVWVESTSMTGASETGGVVAELVKVLNVNSARQERVHMPNGLLADPKALAKFLFDQGINLDPTNKDAKDHIRVFLQSEVIRKQNEMKFVIRDRFGYHFHEGQFVCSLGAHTVYPDGVIRKTLFNRALGQVGNSLGCASLPAEPKGEWEPGIWKDAVAPAAARYVQFLRKHYGHKDFEVARLSIALALASPFLVFTADAAVTESAELPATGFVVSMYSRGSGRGKSSIQEVVAAAFGRPDLKRAGKREAMTAVAAATTAKTMAVYPFILDEVTQNEAKQAAGMIDTFANGQGRIRARQDGSVAKSAETWALVTLMSTNVSQRELLAMAQKQSNALLMRMIELDFDSVPAAGDKLAFSADLKTISAEAGSFGLLLALCAVQRGPEKMTALAQENMARAYKALHAEQDYRFFARGLAALLTMNQLLGRMAPFDEDELIDTFCGAVADTRQFVDTNTSSPSALLHQFLNAHAASILVTKDMRHRYEAGGSMEILLNPHVRAPYVGREIKDSGRVLVGMMFFRQWCAEQQISASGLLNQLQNERLLVVHDGCQHTPAVDVARGLVGLPTTRMRCYEFVVRGAAAQASGDNVVELRRGEDAPASTEDVANQ